MKRTLGVCYYPEHWPEAQWADDAQRMADLGLTWVRIGEFAWSQIEPKEGFFDWGWLDRAIETLGAAGLKVVLGTPTATPPRWVVDKHPDMLARDASGALRGFGSRRHYCFSHAGYLEEAKRIVAEVAERYGAHPHVAAWQTDNEYGCHDTTLSYSEAARDAFRDWLRVRYGQIDTLNAAWGTAFWSMRYDHFDQIGLPNLTVTEPAPAHLLDFRRFSSAQVVAFNRAQTEIIRQHSDAPVAHNYMGRVTEFDHFAVGADLEIASWDSYPLGFLEDRMEGDATYKAAFQRQGDPDFQAFHHDLYRAVGRGRWWIMEQQPGPVNWAAYNPTPLPGMVRLWTWEAFAHGAEAVCYFRWRQAPFAQEQMHAGLLRPDSAEAQAFGEALKVAGELEGEVSSPQGHVGLIFDYEADWAWSVQPHGQGLSYFALFFEWYRALRRMGLNIDILPPDARDFDGYAMVCAPGMMHMPQDLKAALAGAQGVAVVGPRTAARDDSFGIPVPLPPDLPDAEITVDRVDTFRTDTPLSLVGGGAVVGYLEELTGTFETILVAEDTRPVAVRGGPFVYVAGWLDAAGLDRVLRPFAEAADLNPRQLPEGLRMRETESERFWFNYTASSLSYEGKDLPAAGVIREAI